MGSSVVSKVSTSLSHSFFVLRLFITDGRNGVGYCYLWEEEELAQVAGVASSPKASSRVIADQETRYGIILVS